MGTDYACTHLSFFVNVNADSCNTLRCRHRTNRSFLSPFGTGSNSDVLCDSAAAGSHKSLSGYVSRAYAGVVGCYQMADWIVRRRLLKKTRRMVVCVCVYLPGDSPCFIASPVCDQALLVLFCHTRQRGREMMLTNMTRRTKMTVTVDLSLKVPLPVVAAQVSRVKLDPLVCYVYCKTGSYHNDAWMLLEL
jgi:hypothetical protein